ncbi:unnamed protein product [Closterium sp. Yama58-4]|nr:unnamed protein product [Closterium sp. Yama58-4]
MLQAAKAGGASMVASAVSSGSRSGQASLPLLPPGFRFKPTDEELASHYLYPRVRASDDGRRALAALTDNGNELGPAPDCSWINIIASLDVFDCEPWQLPPCCRIGDESYFFARRSHKYGHSRRTNRCTTRGYWKATGNDRTLPLPPVTAAGGEGAEEGEQTAEAQGQGQGQGQEQYWVPMLQLREGVSVVGMKKTLVFYEGRAPRGKRTDWVMHEYRLEQRNSHAMAANGGGGGSGIGSGRKPVGSLVLCRVLYKGAQPPSDPAAADATQLNATATVAQTAAPPASADGGADLMFGSDDIGKMLQAVDGTITNPYEGLENDGLWLAGPSPLEGGNFALPSVGAGSGVGGGAAAAAAAGFGGVGGGWEQSGRDPNVDAAMAAATAAAAASGFPVEDVIRGWTEELARIVAQEAPSKRRRCQAAALAAALAGQGNAAAAALAGKGAVEAEEGEEDSESEDGVGSARETFLGGSGEESGESDGLELERGRGGVGGSGGTAVGASSSSTCSSSEANVLKMQQANARRLALLVAQKCTVSASHERRTSPRGNGRDDVAAGVEESEEIGEQEDRAGDFSDMATPEDGDQTSEALSSEQASKNNICVALRQIVLQKGRPMLVVPPKGRLHNSTPVPPIAPRFGAILWANVKAPNRAWRRVSASGAASSVDGEAPRANDEPSKAAGCERVGGNAVVAYRSPRASPPSPPSSTTQLRQLEPFGSSVAVSAPSEQDVCDTSVVHVTLPPQSLPLSPLPSPPLRSVVPRSPQQAPAPFAAPVPRRLERRRSFPLQSARRSDIGEISEFCEFGECLIERGSATTPTVPATAADDSDGGDGADGSDGGDGDVVTGSTLPTLLDDATAAVTFQEVRPGVTEIEEGAVGEEEAPEWECGVVRSEGEAEVEQGDSQLETEEDAEGGEKGGEEGEEERGVEGAEEDSAAGEVVPEEEREAEKGISLTQDGNGAMEDQSKSRQLCEAESSTAGQIVPSTRTLTENITHSSPETFTETPNVNPSEISRETFVEASKHLPVEERLDDVGGEINEVGGADLGSMDGGTGYAGSRSSFGSTGSVGILGSSGNGSASGYGRGSYSSSSGGGGAAAVWDAMLMEALSPLPRDTLLTRPFTMQRRLSEVDQEASDSPASPTLSPSISLSPDPFQVFSRSTYRTSYGTQSAHHPTSTARTSRVSRSSHTTRTSRTSRTSHTSYGTGTGTVLFPALFSPALSGRPDSSSDREWSSPVISNRLTRAASSAATGAADWAARGSGGESGRGSGGWRWGGSEGRGSGGWGMGEGMGEGMWTEGGAEQLSYEELLLLDEGIAPRGLTPRELWGLDRLTVTQADLHSHPDCQICLSPPVEGDLLANLPCHHTFHNACITTWFCRNRTCPLCRFEIAATS